MIAGSIDSKGCIPVVCIWLKQMIQDENDLFFSQPKIADQSVGVRFGWWLRARERSLKQHRAELSTHACSLYPEDPRGWIKHEC